MEKDQQGETYFVKIKAKFLPDRDLFGFDSLIGVPTTEMPKFIKFKDKTKAKPEFKKSEYKKSEFKKPEFKKPEFKKPDPNKPAPAKPKLKSKKNEEVKPEDNSEATPTEQS